MTLTIYLIKKYFKAFIICGGVSYSIFFIFSLIGNLGEKFSFKSILYLSTLNSFQIFTYIPSHLFILSLCLFIIHLKSKNELIIIKEYIELTKLFLIILPILATFTFIEIKKETFSAAIEKIKSDLISSKNLVDTKILISEEGNKKEYTIFSGYDESNTTINQYLKFEILNQTILRGEISSNLKLFENNLFSYGSTIYESDDFRQESIKKKLFENFFSFWSDNTEAIIKNKANSIKSHYDMIQSFLFYILFYFCISMIFLSKKLVNRGINTMKIFLLILSIFLYYLLIPKIMINNFQFFFQIISIIIFVLIFFKIKQYE
tara:strand:+ start:414 stop:1370 length:957 start_codon:yes stop_codon:yes gene_type:complete